MEDTLQGLNKEQQEAVTTTEGYVRVIAGAGSGKTRALTHRYAYLVNDLGISTANILCVTFTNKAANEMKKRIREMIGDNDTGFICTFHGFCVQLLREDIHVINYPENFMILDTEDLETILKTVYETIGIKSKDYTFDMAKSEVSTFKKEGRHIPYFKELDNEQLRLEYENEKNIKKKIALGYIYEQKKCYGLDFDDLISTALYILETYEDKRRKWQERMMYVMVDEFQDVSATQYDLADILSAYHKNLFVVGDPDQTIYSWRGADIDYILKFDQLHQPTKTIMLNQNYRSTPDILDASNSLIRNNKNRIEKDLVAIKERNTPVLYFHGRTTVQEAQWITSQIKTLMENGVSYDSMAILYRAHHVSRSLEEAFIREKIPYVLFSGIEFYKRKEIKDILSYLRMLVYADDLSFKRVVNEPKRNFGKKRMEFLQQYALAHHCSLYQALLENLDEPLIEKTQVWEFVALIERYKNKYENMRMSDLLTAVLNDSGYEKMLRQMGEQERLDNLSELKQSVYEFEKNAGEECKLEEYLQNIALFSNADKEEKQNSVKMMTIHTAKGLEFPFVFVCGLNEGIFPTKHVDTEEKMEEERRLAYVAYTRAENALFLTDAEGVNFDESFRYPSRFIFNTEKQYLKYEVELADFLMDVSRKYIEASERRMGTPMTAFKVGDRVVHKVFGTGIIKAIRNDISVYVIQFENSDTERNLSFRAPLEKEGQ